ncbi:molecular chaperone GrpE [Sulfurivirga caldicuralii]|uniref:Protein GrpE n=1 Tax=Sulfurivirga caldicuralii TaxID=364032 RepID=A0A1N6E3A2_9GAMM|nr:nucleotide exchange factor GrpE [Sulfurivirga caldicuralii]SIN77472.1 molecular chaperone GrpE [Sulfurivirga caldicuralii]
MSEENKNTQQNPEAPSAEEAIQDLEQAEAQVEQDLEKALQEAKQQAADHWEQLLRVKADMENLRRRTRIDVENAHKFALEKFVNALLPVVDSLEMGIQAAHNENATIDSLREGMEMTLKLLLDTMAEFGVERINPEGEAFDPQKHEAMTMVPVADKEPNTVIEVVQKGYSLNDRLVRPARVVVSKEAE